MCHLRHRLRILLFDRKVIFCSRDIQVFLFLTIPWFTKSVTSWQVLVNEKRCIFLLTHQALSIDRYKQGQYFPEIFWTTWRTGANFQAYFSLGTCSNYSITTYIKYPLFHFFWKGQKGRIKNGKHQVQKIDRSRYIFISVKL